MHSDGADIIRVRFEALDLLHGVVVHHGTVPGQAHQVQSHAHRGFRSQQRHWDAHIVRPSDDPLFADHKLCCAHG